MKKLLAFLLAALMILSLVACGGEKENTEESENTESIASQQQEDTESPAEETTDDNYKFDIKDDDNTVVITIGNTIQVFTHDGVNVTGYATYVDCGDAETAKAVAKSATLDSDYNEGLGRKSVTTKGSYMIAEYDETGFPCKTYEELHSLAEQYKQLQQQGAE